MDYRRFRVYLKEKYNVEQAFLFLGYLETQSSLYAALQKHGFILIFKPTLKYKDGHTKGNCDTELVLHTMIRLQEFDKAVIVSGDGDFYCLIKYLYGERKLRAVLVPNIHSYSRLLFPFATDYIGGINTLKHVLEYRKSTPRGPTL